MFLAASALVLDLATDLGVDGTVLYHQDGSQIVATFCPDGATLHDRATCNEFPQKVPAWGFFRETDAACGASLDALSGKVEDLYVKVARVDDQLLALLDAQPHPPAPDQTAAVTAQEAALAAIDQKVDDLKDQIARIREALNGHEDPDLRAQLAALGTQLVTQLGDRATAQAALDTLRQGIVTANASLLDPDTFQGLEGMRSDAAQSLKDTQAQLDAALAQQAACGRAEKMLGDAGFSYEVMSGGTGFADLKPVAATFGAVFRQVETKTDYTGVMEPDGVTLAVDVDGGGKLASFNCNLSTFDDSCNVLQIKGPGGFSASVYSTELEITATDSYAPVLKPILTMPLTGRWELTLQCSDGKKPVYYEYGCAIQLADPNGR